MEYVRLGKSNLMVSRVAFGAMRLSKIGNEESAISLVRKAYEKGINFFDTSRNTPQSEKLLGDAIQDIRKDTIIASKTSSQSSTEIYGDVETTLNLMHIDTIDLYQYETDNFIPQKGGIDGIYTALSNLKASGKIKAIGIVTQDFECAKNAILSNIYDTIQTPFSMISSEETKKLVQLCEENDIGFIAMQPLCGGLVDNIPLAFGFLHQYESVTPLWGAQSESELEQILYFNEHPPIVDEKFTADVERIRAFFN